jgi:D-3-phosphoglycerate dehydrogenase
MEKVIAIPHLGDSTEKSEENCAVMAVFQLMEFMENGNIKNSVNFPECTFGRNGKKESQLPTGICPV